MTAHTPPTLGADGLYLRIDLSHRHRLDAGCGDTISDRQQPVGRLPVSDASVSRRSSACGVKGPASPAAFAVASGNSTSIFVMVWPLSGCLGPGHHGHRPRDRCRAICPFAGIMIA
jgi:hypothetical protein